MITTGTEEPPVPRQPTARDMDPVRIAAAEEAHTFRTGYRRAGRLVVVDRREARLVKAYRQFIQGRVLLAERFSCPSGWSDLYVETADGAEVIEAKSTIEHGHVRQALAQLLDYAPHSPKPARRLAGLFPYAPLPRGVELLHRYGIDCIHRERTGGFRRLPAPEDRRALMRDVWSGRPAEAADL